MSSVVLDASALLALVYNEPGADRVQQAIAEGALISSVNLSEVVAKLSEEGLPADVIQAILDEINLETVAFDIQLAYLTGLLRPVTKEFGLSLGDRSCLVLAKERDLPVLTADRAWADLALGIDVRPIR